MHKSQIFLYLLLALIGGVFAGSFFDLPRTAALIIAIIAVAVIVVFYRRGSRALNPYIALAAFLAIFFVAGILRFDAVNSRKHALDKIAIASAEIRDPTDKHRIKVVMHGYINSEPVESGDNRRFVFYVKAIDFPPHRIKTEEQVLVTARQFPEYQYGQKLQITGVLKIPENFEDFDYKSYLAKDNIYTTAYFPEIVDSDFRLSFLERIKIPVYSTIFKTKNMFAQSLNRSIAEPNASFVGGILLGTRSQIPQEIKDAFTRTSMSHVLAVSGYNITLVALVISWFFMFFFKRPTAFWFSLAGVAFFTILTGAQASVVRAAFMGMLVLVAQRTGRLSDARNSVILAGSVMILLSPQILRHDIGFQLSFMATLGLIYLNPAIERYFARVPKFFGLRDTILATISAQVFVLPLLVFYFKNISLVSLPVNILILPTIPFAMFLGFMSGLGGLITPVLGQLIGHLAWLLTALELGVIKSFANIEWATVPATLRWYGVAAAYLILAGVILKLKKRQNA